MRWAQECGGCMANPKGVADLLSRVPNGMLSAGQLEVTAFVYILTMYTSYYNIS